MKNSSHFPSEKAFPGGDASDPLLNELVGYLRENQLKLRAEWVRRALQARLLNALGRREVEVIADSIIDGYVSALAKGGLRGLRDFLGCLPDHLGPLGVGSRDAPGLAGLLRDVFGRSLFRQFRHYQGRRAEAKPVARLRRLAWPLAAPAF